MSLATLARTRPRLIDWSIRLDRAPAMALLALQAAALAPTWLWMAARLRDGSDDPLGLLALAALALLVWQVRHELRASPRLGWLALAMCGTLACTLLQPVLPPLASGLLAVLALACGLSAFLPRRVAMLPVAGLAVLALPLLSSLQFYAGYPLRVITAEASRWLLAPAFGVLREGTTLLVDGRMIIVDAPCSGVQMAWLGYFTACVVALWAGRNPRAFLARLPLASLLVMTGNIARNAVLVAFEGAGRPLAPWAHDAFGLLVLAAVCGGIAWTMASQPMHTSSKRNAFDGDRRVLPALERFFFANHFMQRIAHKAAFALTMVLCVMWSAASALRGPDAAAPMRQPGFHEQPREWDGALLRPLALSAVEQRFAQRFPGSIARMTDGTQTLVLREVASPTRMLHPAADCYRALGFRIQQARLERDARERLWRCFVADRPGTQKLRVCERIVDAAGNAFTDTSAWYWAAASGTSAGPWQAVTVARAVE